MTTPGLDLDAADELYAAVGFRITRIRRARGLRQEDLAAAVGLTRSSIANTESGRQRLPLHTLLAVAQALGVELADLFDASREMPLLAQKLPDNTRQAVKDALGDVNSLRATLGNLASALEPLLGGGDPS